MSDMFRDALRAKRERVTATLRCPRCQAQNRPGATYIEIDQTGTRAFCSVCSIERPLAEFQTKDDQ